MAQPPILKAHRVHVSSNTENESRSYVLVLHVTEEHQALPDPHILQIGCTQEELAAIALQLVEELGPVLEPATRERLRKVQQRVRRLLSTPIQ